MKMLRCWTAVRSLNASPSIVRASIVSNSVFSNFTRRSFSSGDERTLQLNSGCFMPTVGFGTWKMKPCEAYEAVKCAIAFGYRHIDCALVYQNEREVGQAIRDKITDGTVTREQLFITSKLWNTYHGCYEVVKRGLDQTLCDLGLSYLDLYLVHWPFGFENGGALNPLLPDGSLALKKDVHFCQVWAAMEVLQREQKMRNIGVSNFNASQIERLLQTAEIPPVVNQVENHPYLNQICLSTFCRERGIHIVAYSPLGSPGIAGGAAGPLDDPVVKCIADTHRKTPGQILIRYQIQRGHAPIPKSVNPERMRQNLDVFSFCLTEQEMNQLIALEKGKNGRVVPFLKASSHPEYPFKELLADE